MNLRNLAIYIDEIRKAKKITREDFLFEVVSLRQYKRYLYGESEIPFNIVISLARRVDIEPLNLLYDFEQEIKKETKTINSLFYHVANYDFEKVEDLLKVINKDAFLSERNEIYYKYTVITYDYFTRKNSGVQTASLYASLIDYPKILNFSIIDSVDMFVLSNLIDFVSKEEQADIVEKIKSLLDNDSKVIAGNIDYTYPRLITKLGKYYGMNNMFDEVIEVCHKGISNAMDSKNLYCLEYFYYYLAIAYFRLENYSLRDKYIFLTYSAVNTRNDQKMFNKFNTLIEKDFDIKYDRFMNEYNIKHF
ncbi:hypothetical protein CI105_07380 [Candidatus Izimaplasma bacterium ZiA1]|uniref:hypothetical protein n=1 Tax=Candidatus Izimoplasma sp. ZiA1 TaxID=2024899 RepID=UPI000BAA4192|nr:hypothetical protein CI105_07380 [Candidatus Izimaplasma bacterium ZiA1]